MQKDQKLFPLSRNPVTNVRKSPSVNDGFISNLLFKVNYPSSLGIATGKSTNDGRFDWYEIQTRRNGIGWVRQDVATTFQPSILTKEDLADKYLAKMAEVDFKNFHLMKTTEGFLVKIESKGIDVANNRELIKQINKEYEERQKEVQAFANNNDLLGFKRAVSTTFSTAWEWLRESAGFSGLGYLWLVRLAPFLWRGVLFIGSSFALDRVLTFFEGGQALEKAEANEKELQALYSEVSEVVERELTDTEREELKNVMDDTFKSGFKEGRKSANMFNGLTTAISLGAAAYIFSQVNQKRK